MSQETTLDPFDVAVQAAKDQMSQGSDIEPVASDPLVDTEAEAPSDDAPSIGDEQAEDEGPPAGDDGEESDELFADVEIEEDEAPAPPSADSFLLPGIDEPVNLEELKNGYLRQADYTRKTQELATQRKDAARADQFWKALTEHPRELAQQLAVAAGLIEAGDAPAMVVDLPFMSEEAIQAEVQARVEKALAEHPAVLEAQRVEAVQYVETEFARIEESYGVKLGPVSREKVLREAVRMDTDNIELVYLKLKAATDKKASQREDLKRASTQKPTGKSSEAATPKPIKSFEDAVDKAYADIAARGNN